MNNYPTLNNCDEKFGFVIYQNTVYVCLGLVEKREGGGYWCYGIEVDEDNIPVCDELKVLIWHSNKDVSGTCDEVLSFDDIEE